MKRILLLIFLVSPLLLFGQTYKTYPDTDNPSGNKKLDLLKEADVFEQRLSEFIPWKEKYRYLKFENGNLFYSPRNESDTLWLNYNLLFRQVVVINDLDTTLVSDFQPFKYVRIKNDLYFHDYLNGYYEIISDQDEVIRLTAQRKLKIVKREKLKDTEKPDLVSTDKFFSVIYYPLNPTFPREKVTLAREINFFLLDGNENAYIATKANFLRLFPKQQRQIRSYLKEKRSTHQRVRFYDENDLKKLIQYCVSLL